jgi:hypothetical protein
LGWKGSTEGPPYTFFAKDLIVKELRRKIVQGFDSKGVMSIFAMSEELRRRLKESGGGPTIHVERIIAHNCLFVKYLCENWKLLILLLVRMRVGAAKVFLGGRKKQGHAGLREVGTGAGGLMGDWRRVGGDRSMALGCKNAGGTPALRWSLERLRQDAVGAE